MIDRILQVANVPQKSRKKLQANRTTRVNTLHYYSVISLRINCISLVIVIRVKSPKLTDGKKVTYEVKVSDICKSNSGAPRWLKAGNLLTLSVNEEQNNDISCLCPNLVSGRSYRMGVNLGSTSKTIELPMSFYLKVGTTC